MNMLEKRRGLMTWCDAKHSQKIKVTVYGWKIWIAFDPESGIPIAMIIDGINVADNTHAYELLDQARKNLD